MVQRDKQSSRWWKRVAVAALLAAVGLLVALVVVVALSVRKTRLADDRLIGSWQPDADRLADDRLIGSWQPDADRTIAGIRERKPVDEKQEAELRKEFSKLRVTYTPTTYSAVLDGTTETYRYKVLGKDQHSVVIHDPEQKASPLSTTKWSEFTVIHFDGTDSYWLDTQLAEIREYFKRVQ